MSQGREVLEWPHIIGGGGLPHPPGPPPPPDQSDHRAKNENFNGEYLVGPFLVHKLLGPRPPPFLSSSVSLVGGRDSRGRRKTLSMGRSQTIVDGTGQSQKKPGMRFLGPKVNTLVLRGLVVIKPRMHLNPGWFLSTFSDPPADNVARVAHFDRKKMPNRKPTALRCITLYV